jgi:hypothetical protein
VASKRIQCDEIWSFCYAKQRVVKIAAKAEKEMTKDAGDARTWTALDADSKLIVSYLTGNARTPQARRTRSEGRAHTPR